MEQHASGGMWSLMSVSCILLVRNGVETIERELRAIDGVVIAHLPGSELIVAEDGSDEATRAAVERVRGALSLRVVGGAERKGYAETLADAVAAASWPIAFVCDGGLQYDPNEFWRVWEGRERADVVIGRRRETVFRRALALWLRLWFGVPLRDAASGFRIYGRRVRDEILARGLFFRHAVSAEVALRALHAGMRVGEVPITEPAGAARVRHERVLPRAVWMFLADLRRLKQEWRRRAA